MTLFTFVILSSPEFAKPLTSQNFEASEAHFYYSRSEQTISFEIVNTTKLIFLVFEIGNEFLTICRKTLEALMNQ